MWKTPTFLGGLSETNIVSRRLFLGTSFCCLLRACNMLGACAWYFTCYIYDGFYFLYFSDVETEDWKAYVIDLRA